MADEFSPLKDDHRKVEQLFEQFEQSGDFEVFLQISRELAVHSTVEEELVYPLLRTKVAYGRADEARDEHQHAKDLIVQIESMGADSDQLGEKVAELKAAVQHHVEEEENEIFPMLEREIPQQLRKLSQGLVHRKEELTEDADEDASLGLAASSSAQKPTSGPNPDQ